jgi:hypothetical protein
MGSEQRNAFLAIVLSAAILFGFSIFVFVFGNRSSVDCKNAAFFFYSTLSTLLKDTTSSLYSDFSPSFTSKSSDIMSYSSSSECKTHPAEKAMTKLKVLKSCPYTKTWWSTSKGRVKSDSKVSRSSGFYAWEPSLLPKTKLLLSRWEVDYLMVNSVATLLWIKDRTHD